MAQTFDGVIFPLPEDQHDWHNDIRRLAQTAKGIPAASSLAAANALTSAAADAGVPATTLNPIIVYRTDTKSIQSTTDGTTWDRVDLGDTGWVTLTKGAGFGAGSVSYRKKSGVGYLSFDLDIGTASSTAVLATLPTSARPEMRISGRGEGPDDMRFLVQANGQVNVFWTGSPASNVTIRGSVAFPAGS